MNYHCSVLYNIQFLLNWEGTEKEVEEEKEETYIQIGRLVKGKVWMHYIVFHIMFFRVSH